MAFCNTAAISTEVFITNTNFSQTAARQRAFLLQYPKMAPGKMGLVFEELIRRFAQSANETAGEHFTPRDKYAKFNSSFLSRSAEIYF